MGDTERTEKTIQTPEPGTNPAVHQPLSRKKLRKAEIRREARILIKDGVPRNEGCQILRERFDCSSQFAQGNWREVEKTMGGGVSKPRPSTPEEILDEILASAWRALRIAEGQQDAGKMCQALKLISDHTVNKTAKKPVGRPPQKKAADIPTPEDIPSHDDVEKAIADARAAGLDVPDTDHSVNGQVDDDSNGG